MNSIQNIVLSKQKINLFGNLKLGTNSETLQRFKMNSLKTNVFKSEAEPQHLTRNQKHFKESKRTAKNNVFKKAAFPQKFDAKTEALQRFKISIIWKIKLPKKTLNPKLWNQIRWISVIQNEQYLKTNVWKKRDDETKKSYPIRSTQKI